MSALENLIRIMNDDGVVILPTDTTLGLCCLSSSHTAIERIYQIKQRERNKPLSLLVSSLTQIEEIAMLNDTARKLLTEHTPGSITLVCNLKPGINFACTTNNTIGLRISNHLDITSLIERLKAPIVATSVNLANEKEATDYENISLDIIKQVDYVLHGALGSGVASRVIDVTSSTPLYLR